MTDHNEFDIFIKNGCFNIENIDLICEDLDLNSKQLLRKTFKYLNSLIGSMESYHTSSSFINKIYNSISLINLLCENEKFSEDEIKINRIRIKKARESLLAYYNKYKSENILECANLLDEVILDKNININDLILLIKELIKKKEDINIIKKLLNNNKGAIIINNNVLFDYSFNNAINAILDNNPDIYYYIALLKIFYSTTIDKTKYINLLNEYTDDKNEFANEIYKIIHGDKRCLSTKEILSKYGIVTNLNSITIPSMRSRKSNEFIITIDDYNTKLRDDAISIKQDGENYIVGIHITNPGKFIVQNSEVDIQAKNNYKNIYIPHGGPRLFSSINEENLSLNEGKTRSVISMYVVFDKDANVKDYYIKDNVIKIDKNLSYSESNRIINIKNSDIIHTSLNDLYMITSKLEKKNTKKTEYWSKKSKDELDLYIEKGNTIIAELMVLYNTLMATLACEESYPYIYRTQDDSYLKKLIKKLGVELDESTEKSIKAIFLPSKYSCIPLYHNGLNIPKYSHSVDPLRRYPDLYNQYLTHFFYFHDIDFRFDYDEYLNLIDYCNQRNVELSLMRAEYIRALKLEKKD